MAIFVPKMLRSGRQLTSAPLTNNSAEAASDSSHFNSNHDDASKRHSFLAQLDPQMVTALLAAGPSALAARASLAHSFGSALWLAQAIAQAEGDSTCAPVIAEEPENYTSKVNLDAADSTSSLVSSCSTRYSFDASTLAAKVGVDHLTHTLRKYDQAKVIDITPSESMHTIERKTLTESKEKKAKGAGGGFFAGLRKIANSTRKIVNLNPHKSTATAGDTKVRSETQVGSVNSTSSSVFIPEVEPAEAGQLEPAKFDAPSYEREVLFDYSDESNALAERSTPLDALFGGPDVDDSLSSPPSPMPPLCAFDTRFFPLSTRLPSSSSNRTKRASLFELTMLSAQKECSLGIHGAVDFSCGAGGDRARRGRYDVGWGEDWSFWAVEGEIDGGEEEEKVEWMPVVIQPLRWTRKTRPVEMAEVAKNEGVRVTVKEIAVEDGAGVVGGGGAKKVRRGSRVWFC